MDKIDGQFVADNFRLENVVGVSEGRHGRASIPGCPHTKSFEIVEDGASGEILVALCTEGKLGPRDIEASVAGQVSQAEASLQGLPAPLADLMRSGIAAVDFPLEAGSHGKALTIPVLGHGFLMMPFAYAITAKRDATIVVQAHLNPNKPRNLTAPVAALLKAIHKRVLQGP